MSAQNLLDQLLRSGLSALGGGAATPAAGADRGSDFGKYVSGAAAGGALALLLGTRRGRRVGGKVLKYGSVAALGAVAWNAYQQWQAKQVPAAAPAATPPAPAGFVALPAPQREAHSQAMLKAMIAAAKSDGHMDDRERGLVEAELHRLAADPALRAWVDAELQRPVEPGEVAAAVTGPAMAAEVYLASVLVVDETTTMERAYLDELARRLGLDAALQADLERRAAAD